MKQSIAKKGLALWLAISMICSCFVWSASAAETKKSVSVIVRIEAGDKTLVYPTRVKVDNFSLAPFGVSDQKDAPTALHALIKALDLDEVGPDNMLDFDPATGFINKIDGIQTNDYYSWMYAVNDKLPDVGCLNYELQDDDEIVFYYSNIEIGSYAYFIEPTKIVAAGESFGMILNSVFFDNGAKFTGPVEGAQVLISKEGEKDATIKTGIKTDVLGSFKLTIDEPGTYVVSAERYGYKYADTSNISRARSVITVTGTAKPTVKPTLVAGKGGSISLSADNRIVTITPDQGYKVKDVTVDGMSVGAVTSYTFSETQKGAKVEAAFEKKATTTPDAPPTNGFVDVADHWAKDAIEYVVANGLFSGVTDQEFAPNAPMTRGMFVTVLGRYAKVNDVSGENGFSDVKEDAYYAPFVTWASQNHIVSGFDSNTFAPDATITREQMALIMKNFAEYKLNTTVSANRDSVNVFTDHDKISSWALDSMAYCVEEGLVSGKGQNLLDPQGTATRAEVATILQKFITSVF